MPMHAALRARRTCARNRSTPASTATRGTPRGSTRVAVVASWRSNTSVHGIDTTRTAMPACASSFARAERELHFRAGRDQHDRGRRRRRPTAHSRRARCRDLLGVRCWNGRFWRVRSRLVGPSLALDRGAPGDRRLDACRTGARRPCSESGAGSRRARPAGASGRLRRGRSNRA